MVFVVRDLLLNRFIPCGEIAKNISVPHHAPRIAILLVELVILVILVNQYGVYEGDEAPISASSVIIVVLLRGASSVGSDW